jgi:hypothetical protein
LNELVKDSVADELPDRFGLLFDGWSMGGEHYTAIFATWVNDSGYVVKRLLSCGVQSLPDEAAGETAEDFGFTAEDIGDYLYDVLEDYGRNYGNLEFLCGDNAYVNGRLCRLIEKWLFDTKNIKRHIPLIGCACHRLNLAVKTLFADKTENGNLVKKVHKLMVDLCTLKNSFKLGAKTSLCAEVENDTRWGSTYKMLLKYLKLAPILNQCNFSRNTKALFPSEVEKDKIKDLCDMLEQCQMCSAFLQNEDSSLVTLQTTRIALDELIEKFGGNFPDFAEKLKADADVVYSTSFESAVVKVQTGKESRLTMAEKNAIAAFKIDDGAFEANELEGEQTEESYTERIARKAEREKSASTKKSAYRNLAHICPTSVVVERLFSRAKLIMTPHRRRMDPTTLEMFLLLRFNNDKYNARTLDAVIEAFRQDAISRKRAREEETKEAEEDASVEADVEDV